MSLTEMGRELGVGHDVISRWERGLRSPRERLALPYLQLLERLEAQTYSKSRDGARSSATE
jgi:transcriptional regulator with XRE-family HTH domain